jgi:hypothetical protein
MASFDASASPAAAGLPHYTPRTIKDTDGNDLDVWHGPTLELELAEKKLVHAAQKAGKAQAREAKKAAMRAAHEAARANGADGLTIPLPPLEPLPGMDPEMEEEVEPNPDAPVICAGTCGRRCGRLVAPYMMRDIRGLPDEVRRNRRGDLSTHCCDACEQEMYRREEYDRVSFLEDQGAPRRWLDHIQRKLDRDPHSLGNPKRINPKFKRKVPNAPS